MLLTHTDYITDLTGYAESPEFDVIRYVELVKGISRARVDISIVPGTPSGYLCERCNQRPEMCSVDAFNGGVEDLCYRCTVIATDDALYADPDGSVSIEVRRPLLRD